MIQPFSRSNYVVITPARNEESFIAATIESLVRQTVPPAEWVIVNDGSTDGTGEVIDRYARQYPWIRGVHRDNRGFRKAGGGVVEAFYDGFHALTSSHWEFVVKLDADLTLEETYFERCMEYFRNDPRLGIAGGTVYNIVRGRLELEKTPNFHVRGASKIYRRDCWDAIGGLWPAPGWDTIDEVKANMLGWQTRSFPHLRVLHRRLTGAADGAWRNWVKNGRANYVSGYHPLFMLLKCLKRTVQKPYLVSAAGLLYGYVSGYLRGIPQVEDPALIGYIRRQQIRRLLLLESIWK